MVVIKIKTPTKEKRPKYKELQPHLLQDYHKRRESTIFKPGKQMEVIIKNPLRKRPKF